MGDRKDNPLVASLPPETDYLTYLTIVEYNLDKNQLPLLHELLQDLKLTTNIGWDLVHLLLPLLPESEQCLQDISFLGNPRETVLKVAELLDKLGRPEGSVTESVPHIEDDEDEEDDEEQSEQQGEEELIDLLALQFHSLLHMLCILHPRIQTKKPSNFLITSLQAVIQAFKNIQLDAPNQHERVQSAMRSILMLIKSMSGSKRPHLPPRRSQSAIPTVSQRDSAPDPEGNEETLAPGEGELKKQILQSFVTHVLETYVQSLEPIAFVDSSLALTSRYHEKKQGVPGKPKFAQAHEAEEELERADAMINQLLSTAESDLHISWDDLLHCALDAAHTDANHKSIFTIPDFPASQTGALYALASKVATSLQNDRALPIDISVFPEHSILTELYVDDSSNDVDGDALIILGRAAFDTHGLGEWETRAEFNQYLQRLLQLAAGSGLPNIATSASEFAATILHAHPSSDARFDFILDTLEECPYPELKEAAVFWLRDEISSAFGLRTPSRHIHKSEAHEQNQAEASESQEDLSHETEKKLSVQDKPENLNEPQSFGETSNIFTHSETLKNAAPYIFAQPKTIGRDDMSPAVKAKFWLAALNLYYLLSASKTLYESLEIHALSLEFNIEKDFVGVLENLVAESEQSQSAEGLGEGYGPFLPLIEDALNRLKSLKRDDRVEKGS